MGQGAGEIEEDLGEFGWEHAVFGVASGAGLVAGGVGGDVLGAKAGEKLVAVGDNFEMAGFFAELVVVGGGGGDDGGILGGENETDGFAGGFEGFFPVEEEFLEFLRAGGGGVVGEGDGEAGGGLVLEEFEGWE